jgi:hypothetical protein
MCSNSRIEKLRFKNDVIFANKSAAQSDASRLFEERLERQNLASSTRIVPEVFPEIGKAIEDVREKLIPDYRIDAYIRNAPEFQACCFPGSGETISIAFTSGLIQISSMDELRFIIGHELGHFLLGHHAYPRPDQASSRVEELNILALSRAAEISADRIGFVAASKKEHSYRAVLKLATGLPDRFIRFDLSAYLKQAKELCQLGGSEYALLSSHPLCPVRMRALLWFEMSQPYFDWVGQKGDASLSGKLLDEKIEKDMAAVNGFRLAEINKKEADSAMRWGVLSLFVSDGTLSKDEQALLRQTFGSDVAEDMMMLLKEKGPSEVMSKFDSALRSIRLMKREVKEALYLDLEHFAELAGGEVHVRRHVLEMSLKNMALDREISLC